MRLLKMCTFAGISLAFALVALGSSPGGVPSLTPEQKAIRDAASIADPAAREKQLREAIRQGLFSKDQQDRELVFKYLADNTRWIDLQPFADVLESYSRIDVLHYRALWLLDQVELTHASREDRANTYRQAIVDGAVQLRRGWTLTRRTAISSASLDGMAEIRTLVADHIRDAWSDERDRVLPALDLRAGASDREGAARLASGRLAEMSDEEFVGRMDQDPGFREAALEVASYACSVNPFNGARNPGCAGAQEVMRRQVGLEQKEQTIRKSLPPGQKERSEEVARGQWLERLKNCVR